MTASRQSAALNPLGVDFDRFLYAQVGDDPLGGQLTVVSVLARQGLDPWEEAASLARLPVEGAVRALSALLAKLPASSEKPLDPVVVATFLVSLLPRATRLQPPRSSSVAAAPASGIATGDRQRLIALIAVVCMLLFVATQLRMPRQPDAPATPAVTEQLN